MLSVARHWYFCLMQNETSLSDLTTPRAVAVFHLACLVQSQVTSNERDMHVIIVQLRYRKYRTLSRVPSLYASTCNPLCA